MLCLISIFLLTGAKSSDPNFSVSVFKLFKEISIVPFLIL